jgi:hypothetical protein
MIFNRQDAKGRQKKISDQNLILASGRQLTFCGAPSVCEAPGFTGRREDKKIQRNLPLSFPFFSSRLPVISLGTF